MKKLLLSALFTLTSVTVFSQSDKNVCNLNSLLEELFSVEKYEYNNKVYLSPSINQLDSGTCYSSIVNQSNMYINYLLTHFSNHSYYDELAREEDSIMLRRKFIERVKEDQPFINLIKELVDENRIQRDTVKFDEVMNIAVKFFSIPKITDEGYYSGKVCTGINLLTATEELRMPHIEAFCFSTVFNDYMNNNYGLRNQFINSIKQLYKLNLGVETDERLLRAQGALMILMMQNEDLQQSLKNSYDMKLSFLPFYIKI